MYLAYRLFVAVSLLGVKTMAHAAQPCELIDAKHRGEASGVKSHPDFKRAFRVVNSAGSDRKRHQRALKALETALEKLMTKAHRVFHDVPQPEALARVLHRPLHEGGVDAESMSEAKLASIVSQMQGNLRPPLASEGFHEVHVCRSDQPELAELARRRLGALLREKAGDDANLPEGARAVEDSADGGGADDASAP